jgi:osmotically inducible lipoprotein OsmB
MSGTTFLSSSFGAFTMKPSLLSTGKLSAALLVFTLVLAGCAGMTRQEKGTATGAAVGAVVGNVMCGGVLCTGAGAAVGGAIGHEATK